MKFNINKNLVNVLSEAENVILCSAISNNGVFGSGYNVMEGSDDGIILSDSRFIYPLGKFSFPNLLLPNLKGILGSAINVAKFELEKDWFVMSKIFAKLNLDKYKSIINDDFKKEDIEICLIENNLHLKYYSKLKSAFIFEESMQILNPEIIYNSSLENYTYFCPALLFYKGQAVGMISSNFYSDKSAMINLLFIDDQFRGLGLGKILLIWYINYLSEISDDIYLFYSDDNLVAKRLYDNLGFEKIDDWIMATKN